MRRRWLRRVQCAEAGCNEFVSYQYDTKRERDEAARQRRPWRCSRRGW